MALRYMQLFQTALAFSTDGIAESGFGSDQLLVFEVAYEAPP